MSSLRDRPIERPFIQMVLIDENVENIQILFVFSVLFSIVLMVTIAATLFIVITPEKPFPWFSDNFEVILPN